MYTVNYFVPGDSKSMQVLLLGAIICHYMDKNNQMGMRILDNSIQCNSWWLTVVDSCRHKKSKSYKSNRPFFYRRGKSTGLNNKTNDGLIQFNCFTFTILILCTIAHCPIVMASWDTHSQTHSYCEGRAAMQGANLLIRRDTVSCSRTLWHSLWRSRDQTRKLLFTRWPLYRPDHNVISNCIFPTISYKSKCLLYSYLGINDIFL